MENSLNNAISSEDQNMLKMGGQKLFQAKEFEYNFKGSKVWD